MVGAAAMSSSSTPAWRAAPALRRHCRCGGRASVTSWRRRCHWFGNRTSTRSVVSPPAVSVSSRRHRHWSAAGLDDAAWCRRRPSQCPRGAVVVDRQPGLMMRPGVVAGRCFITSLGSAAPPKTNRASWPSPPLLRLASRPLLGAGAAADSGSLPTADDEAEDGERTRVATGLVQTTRKTKTMAGEVVAGVGMSTSPATPSAGFHLIMDGELDDGRRSLDSGARLEWRWTSAPASARHSEQDVRGVVCISDGDGLGALLAPGSFGRPPLPSRKGNPCT
ncbi:hypothetical protein PVAP13_3KG041415 [Panicum virgatum]|uniref:Uncharacterized protein n=1 Tax=Panicum virgatum TaxID=38727 RepID=A0A8T0UMN4_PANVG|nr:hypothetical protein PVAP13_3KG041415 [Panicum virgatum]